MPYQGYTPQVLRDWLIGGVIGCGLGGTDRQTQLIFIHWLGVCEICENDVLKFPKKFPKLKKNLLILIIT